MYLTKPMVLVRLKVYKKIVIYFFNLFVLFYLPAPPSQKCLTCKYHVVISILFSRLTIFVVDTHGRAVLRNLNAPDHFTPE